MCPRIVGLQDLGQDEPHLSLDTQGPMQRLLIILGLMILVVGLLWPWLSKLPLGRLPGDFMIKRSDSEVFFIRKRHPVSADVWFHSGTPWCPIADKCSLRRLLHLGEIPIRRESVAFIVVHAPILAI